MPMPTGYEVRPLEERLWSMVHFTETCWLWKGGKTAQGYGEIMVSGRPVLAHRLAYCVFNGPIPPSLHVDHFCERRACIRPDHLRLLTFQENVARSPNYNGNKTVCPSGHVYSLESTYFDKAGSRRCRICILTRNKEKRHKRTILRL